MRYATLLVYFFFAFVATGCGSSNEEKKTEEVKIKEMEFSHQQKMKKMEYEAGQEQWVKEKKRMEEEKERLAAKISAMKEELAEGTKKAQAQIQGMIAKERAELAILRTEAKKIEKEIEEGREAKKALAEVKRELGRSMESAVAEVKSFFYDKKSALQRQYQADLTAINISRLSDAQKKSQRSMLEASFKKTESSFDKEEEERVKVVSAKWAGIIKIIP